jgi:hypothetical protein
MTTPDQHTDLDTAPTDTSDRDPGRTDTSDRDPGRTDTSDRDPGRTDIGDQDSRPTGTDTDPDRADRDTDPDTPAAPSDETNQPGEGAREPLVPRQRAEEYGARWNAVKGGFVDEPGQAVAAADQLVSELLDELQELFRSQRHDIEQGLDADQTSTEDFRLALRRYRSFFDRLLSV